MSVAHLINNLVGFHKAYTAVV